MITDHGKRSPFSEKNKLLKKLMVKKTRTPLKIKKIRQHTQMRLLKKNLLERREKL